MKRFPRLFIATVALLIAVAVMLLWNFLAPTHDPQVDAIRKQGQPVTLAELNEWYQRPPNQENAAYVYTNAFARLGLASNVFQRLQDERWIPKRGQAIDADEKAELISLLATNREALRLLYATGAITNSRYPVDLTAGLNALLPDLAPIKGATLILTGEAILHSTEGADQKATEAFLAAGRLANSVSQEPVLISQLVNIACWKIICARLEWVVNATTFKAEELARLQNMIAAAENNSFVRGLVGERAFGYAIFTEPKSQAALFSFPGMRSGTLNPKGQLAAHLMFGLLKTTGQLRKDRMFYLETMNSHVAIAELPFPERFKLMQSAVPNPGRFFILSRMLLPALGKAYLRDAERIARVRVTKTALAVERFRRSNSNALPQELSQLVPDLLAAVPADPYDGKPLRFKKLNAGYVVYSIGSDEHDDGGAEYDKDNRTARTDITFIVEH